MSALPPLSVRWRLALTSAGLTFAILLAFALVTGFLTARQVQDGFDDELRLAAADVQDKVRVYRDQYGIVQADQRRKLGDLAAGDVAIRVVDSGSRVVAVARRNGPDLGPPVEGTTSYAGYRVVTRPIFISDEFSPVAYVQYARPTSSVDDTIARLKTFLTLGVIGGTALALLAGLAVARRAMHPIAALTGAAKDIARTRDPAVTLPKPEADDEVGDLARTLEQMLASLAGARAETEGALARQREFVADASHELRTPLTSVFANLELLEAKLTGEDAEIAQSALRSSRRMRRLVADLLLLARADTGRPTVRGPVDLAQVAHEASAELAPLAADHDLSLQAEPWTVVDGVADDLHRLVVNLLENALVHTPVGTTVRANVRREEDWVVLQVDDDGPGIPPDLRPRVFERFVRGGGDLGGARGSGLGLAIVGAVAEGHGGGVELSESPSGGARFTVRLRAGAAPREEADERPTRLTRAV